MGKITVTPCDIEGLYVIEPTVFKDERGYFVETYNQNDMKEAGLDEWDFIFHKDFVTEENKKQFYIPEGFAHGFLVLSDEAEFCYKCTDFYHPGDEGGLAWNDPEIGVEWPLEEGVDLIISEKDQKWKGLKDTFKF